MPMFLGCTDCCDTEAVTPCGTAPYHGAGGWPYSESLWDGTGYTAGSIVSYHPSLTGFVTHSSQWSVSASSGVTAPSLQLEMQASIDIDGVDGRLVSLDYILFDDEIEVSSALCNSALAEVQYCCHAMGSIRKWTESNLEGESTRTVPVAGIVIERGGVYSFCPTPTAQMERTKWKRLTGATLYTPTWYRVIPGASFNAGLPTIRPAYTFLSVPPLVRIGFGVISIIQCFEDPDNVTGNRSMEIPRLRVDNLNLDYSISSTTGSFSCHASQTSNQKEASVNYAFGSASHFYGANGGQIEVTQESGYDCYSGDVLKLKFTGDANWSASVFLPVIGMPNLPFDDYYYLKLWGSCIEYLGTSLPTVNLHPALLVNGSLYAGRYATTPTSTTQSIISPTSIWTAATCSMGLVSSVLQVFYEPYTECYERPVCTDIYGYGRPQVGYGWRVLGAKSAPSNFTGYLDTDAADRPVCSWITQPTIVGGVIVSAGSLFAESGKYLYLRSLFARDTQNNLSGTFDCIAYSCSVAEKVTIEVTGGAMAGTYVMDFPHGMINANTPVCTERWNVGGSQSVTYRSDTGVSLQNVAFLQTWTWPSGTTVPAWNTSNTVSLVGFPSANPNSATSVTVTRDMSW